MEEQDCLVLVWEAQGSSDEAFDREHDDVAGGAISCANRQALDEAIRAAREAAGEGRGTPLDLPASDTRA